MPEGGALVKKKRVSTEAHRTEGGWGFKIRPLPTKTSTTKENANTLNTKYKVCSPAHN